MKVPSSIVALSLIGTAMASAISPARAAEIKTDAKFICGTSQGHPATVALTSRGYLPVIEWKSEFFSNSGYSAQHRCTAVSERFQQYYKNGMLNYLTTGTANRQPIVCVAATKGGPCSGLLFTLKPGSDPWQTLQRLIKVRVGAAGPLNESTAPSAPASTVMADGYVDMTEFLKTAPVEVLTAPTETPISPQSQLPRGLW